MIFERKKKTYCPNMYVGHNGDCKKYGVMCKKTGQSCIGYEETMFNAKQEIETMDNDRATSRDWTNDVMWRLEVGIIRRCPSNWKRTNLAKIMEKELSAERSFFRD